MFKISNSHLLGIVMKLLIILAVTKSIALAIWWFLPDESVEIKEDLNYNPPYHRVDFKNMLIQVSSSKKGTNQTATVDNSVNITNMILKGLYGNSKEGFIIVALKSAPKKTFIISIGDTFSGYVLKSIIKNGAIFTKAEKEFVLKIKHDKSSKNVATYITPAEEPSSIQSVNRQDIKFYEHNPEQIWKDIAISEIRDGQKINGFKVTSVRRGSKMDKLGLKRGDVIIRANNVELTSYKAAFDLYKKINQLDTVQIVLLRNNEEKELVYEIH